MFCPVVIPQLLQSCPCTLQPTGTNPGKTISSSGKRSFQGTKALKGAASNPQGFLGHGFMDGLCWTFLAIMPLQRQLSRHYPKDFGVAVASLVAKQPPVADLRNKQHVDPMLTDRELFSTMPMENVWWDAKLPQLYWYLRQFPTLSIPESWSSAIQQFEQELQEETHTHHEFLIFLKRGFPSSCPHHVSPYHNSSPAPWSCPGASSSFCRRHGWPEQR